MTLYVLVGPSGAGKTTLQKMFERYGASGVTSSTTRTMREGEIDGKDYHFLSNDEFDSKILAGDFLEHVQFGGNRYGVDEDSVISALAKGKNNVAVIVTEIEGFLEIKEYVKKNDYPFDVKGIFIDAPKDVLIERLHKRGGMSEESIASRIALLDEELENKKYFEGGDDIILSHPHLIVMDVCAKGQVLGELIRPSSNEYPDI